MILHGFRAIFVLAVLAIAINYVNTSDVLKPQAVDAFQRPVGLSPITKVTLLVVIPVIAAVAVILLDLASKRKSLGGISGLFFGLVAGVILAYVLGMVVDLVAAVFLPAHMQVAVEEPGGPRVPAAPRPAAGPAGRVPTSVPASDPATAADDRLDRLSDEVRALAKEQRQFVSALAAAQAPKDTGAKGSQLVGMIKLMVGALAIYLCLSFVMQTKDDFRFIIPYVEFSKQTKGVRPMLLDTSVIIDGRIADIAETRVLESPLIVPRFVLQELQDVADSSDKLKRNRGRRGLDILNRLQKSDKCEVRLMDARVGAVEEAGGVDQKLVALAQHIDGRIVTNDYNLNKIAQLRGVEVMNINDLANALKPVFLPGEVITVKVVKPGEEPGQGVGYLDDGTMVVIELGRDRVGQEVAILVTSMLQTSAGRMIFGRPADAPPPTSGPRPRR